MLLDSNYELIHQLKMTLLFDNDVQKTIIVKVDDIVKCVYKDINNTKCTIVGRIDKIGVNYHSTLGKPIDSTYLKIDGSGEFYGFVAHIKPEQILDFCIVKTTDVIVNPVCSIDNTDMKILLIRENETGVFQYSKDGLTWVSVLANETPVDPAPVTNPNKRETYTYILDETNHSGMDVLLADLDSIPEYSTVSIFIKKTSNYNAEQNNLPVLYEFIKMATDGSWNRYAATGYDKDILHVYFNGVTTDETKFYSSLIGFSRHAGTPQEQVQG